MFISFSLIVDICVCRLELIYKSVWLDTILCFVHVVSDTIFFAFDASFNSLLIRFDLPLFLSVYHVYIVARRVLGFYFYLLVYWLFHYTLLTWMCVLLLFTLCFSKDRL